MHMTVDNKPGDTVVMTSDAVPHTVLVVDDDPVIGDLIAQILLLEGFDPILIQNSQQALQAARDLKPDAITLDLDMPALDGRSVLRGLRTDAATHDVPVVVVSANCQSLSVQEQAQVCRTLDKPFDLPELIQAVSSAVSND